MGNNYFSFNNAMLKRRVFVPNSTLIPIWFVAALWIQYDGILLISTQTWTSTGKKNRHIHHLCVMLKIFFIGSGGLWSNINSRKIDVGTSAIHVSNRVNTSCRLFSLPATGPQVSCIRYMFTKKYKRRYFSNPWSLDVVHSYKTAAHCTGHRAQSL